MREFRYRFIEGSVEHVIPLKAQDASGAHHVEIITDGMRKLVFIDGKRLHRVLDIDLPLTQGEISPQVTLKLHPRSIAVRQLEPREFKALVDGGVLT